MKKSVSLLVLIFLLASCLITPLPASAEPKTIIVPDDYSFIQDAIGNATDGDTVFVKSGTYQEQQLIVNKTLSLVGENPNTTHIILSPPVLMGPFSTIGIDYPVKIEANNVTLSGFTITANGERSVLSGNCGNVIAIGTGTRIIGNILETGATAMGDQTYIADNVIDDKSRSGYPSLTVNGAYQVIMKNVISGIWVEKSERNTITQNSIGCTNESGTPIYAGIRLRSTTENQIFANNIVSSGPCVMIDGYFGTSGLQTCQSENNIFYHNNFVSNSTIIDQVGYGEGNYSVNNVWDNDKEGNYWSNYNGTDNNGNSIGDTPYVIDENNQDNYPLMRSFEISSASSPSPTLSATPEPSSTVSSLGPQPEPFPTMPVLAASAVAITVVAALRVYFKKRKK